VVRGTTSHMLASAFAFGRATGSREFALLDPWASNERVDAVLLTGGSAYGLDAAAGVLRWMEEHQRGYAIAGGIVPIVPAAVVFDLAPLGKFSSRPTAQMAYDACGSATETGWAEGSVGAGTGCTVGKLYGPKHAMKGGLGVGLVAGGSVDACAIAVVNAVGHVRDLNGTIIAGPREPKGGIADTERIGYRRGLFVDPAENTTISLVMLNVAFSKVELNRIARAASAAHARRIAPSGTSFDGDIVFAVASVESKAPQPGDQIKAEIAATVALEEAIVRAVQTAKGRDGVPGLAD
jgi:L-aminopeptidase/D-esterase-like protein